MPAGDVATETARPPPQPKWRGPPMMMPPRGQFPPMPPFGMPWPPYAGRHPPPFPPPGFQQRPSPPASSSSSSTPSSSSASSAASSPSASSSASSTPSDKNMMNAQYYHNPYPHQMGAFGHPPYMPPMGFFWPKRGERGSSRSSKKKEERHTGASIVPASPSPDRNSKVSFVEEGVVAAVVEELQVATIEEAPPSPPPPGELVPFESEPVPPSPVSTVTTVAIVQSSLPPTPTSQRSFSAPSTPIEPMQPVAPGALEVYKPPQVNWLLCGEGGPDQLRLSFDVRYSPSINARITNGEESRRLTTKATLSWAVTPMATEMHIICPLLPWKIRVTNKRGVTVEDVLMRIAEELEVEMTDSERCIVWETEGWSKALDARDRNIKEGTGHSERRRDGDERVRRVDWLNDMTVFKRLTQGLDTEDNIAFTHQRSHQKDRNMTWLLELGSR